MTSFGGAVQQLTARLPDDDYHTGFKVVNFWDPVFITWQPSGNRLGGVEVNITLRLADFDPCFPAQTIDAQTDFAADFVGVGSPDIEPVIEMEI